MVLKYQISGSQYFKIIEYSHEQLNISAFEYLNQQYNAECSSLGYGKIVIEFPNEIMYNTFILTWL